MLALRRRRLIVETCGLSFALLCACYVASAQNPSAQEAAGFGAATFKIAGMVVSSTTGAPLASARVSVFDTTNPQNEGWLITGEDGHFAFDHLPAGKYSLQGGRRGFIAGGYEQHEQYSTAIVTGAGADTENLVLRLVPAAMITGKILDEAGEPVRSARLRLYRQSHDLGFNRVTPSQFASTDDLGSYEFVGLEPGTYYVSVRARPWYAVHPPPQAQGSASLPAFVDSSLDVAYPATFYDGVTDADVATPVPVKGGDHLEIDLHLKPVPAVSLLLHGTKNGGFLTPTVRTRVFDATEIIRPEGIRPVSEDTYELIGVPAGKYSVHLPGSSAENAGRSAEMNLTKSDQEVDAAAGEPLANVKVFAKIAGQNRNPQDLSVVLRDSRMRVVGFQPVDQNGEVRFDDLAAGKYALTGFTQSKQYAVVPGSSEGLDASGTLSVRAGSSIVVSVLLATADAKVEGFVKRSGKAASGIMVVLVPADPESHLDFFRRDQSDLDGSFALRNVIPGSYTVIAIEDGWTLDWSQPAVLARYTPKGEKLTISADLQDSVHLLEPVEVQPR